MYLIDANENTVASYEYDPYGNIVSATGSMAEINPLRYRGYYYDTELEMYYLQLRYYDPETSRFINADDPVCLGANSSLLGYNLFAYCLNNPINMVDYSGAVGSPIQWACAVLGAVVGVALGDFVARNMGLAPSGKGRWNAVKYWAVRAAVVAGAAAIGYLVGTGIVKLVGLYVKSNPGVSISLIKKYGIDTSVKIMNTFGINFLKYMKPGTLINFVANWFNSPTKKMSLGFTKLLVEACKALGLQFEFHTGHKGTWDVPHLHIGNHKGHLALVEAAAEWIKSLLGIK